jgi:hypothetical protein
MIDQLPAFQLAVLILELAQPLLCDGSSPVELAGNYNE